MKNLKIAMILVAAVALFCSCGDPVAPTATLLNAEGTSEANFDLAKAETMDVALTGTINADKGIKTLNVTKTLFNAAEEVLGDVVEYTFTEPFDGLTTYTFAIEESLAKAEVENAAKVEYKVVVVDSKDVEGTATYTINVVAPVYSEANFEWYRLGNTKEGLAEFGLNWASNAKAIEAVIKPVEGAKLYILTSADYAATELSELTLGAEATQYKSVSCEASKDYDDVIATVYNGKTYLMHITRGEVATVSGQGTKVTITGTYKAFTNAEEPAAK